MIKKGDFFTPVFIEFTYVFAGLIYYISYFQRKVEGGKEEIIYRESTASSIKYIYYEGTQKNFLKKWSLIIFLGFLITCFEHIPSFCGSKEVFEERLYYYFFIPLFSKFILNDQIFKHQYLSLIIAIIGMIFLIIPVYFRIETEDILANIFNLISSIEHSLFLVLIKYLSYVYYRSPFQLSFYFG